jgi:ribosomal protein S18 acetylase RimI-like enzyme
MHNQGNRVGNIEIRHYQKSDYSRCEELVNLAWRFDKIFASEKLFLLAKELYTKGSFFSGNYHMVAETNGKVVGFIFGFNINNKKPKGGLLFGLKAMFKLYFGRANKSERNALIEAATVHGKNRTSVDSRNVNEIVLFVIDEAYRGLGIGCKLWSSFKDHCHDSSSEIIRVETNKLGASGFYEKIGFRFYANFNSPLHELATKGGQACIYEYSKSEI